MSDLTGIDLLAVQGITEAKVRHLLSTLGSVPAIFGAAYAELVERGQTEPELARRLLSYKRDSKTKEDIDHAAALGVTTITCLDAIYPENLKGIPQAPPIIFARGELKKGDARALAVIGTRRATAYGRAAADRFARDFAEAQVTVVSGLARGIDTQVHESCLAAGGRTIAVMGTGMDRIYPPENRRLAERIVKNGALITEFNFGMQPLAMNFPKRNRIISGLSLGIVAVEAKEASGVMNTVNWALNQGRDVFAVPGSIFSKYSLGTNALIKAGAAMAVSAQDVLEELKLVKKQQRSESIELALGEEEAAIMALLSERPVYLDEIAVRLSRPVPAILNTLLTMELKGVIRQLPGKTFVRGFG
jgi:DNA processing protein